MRRMSDWTRVIVVQDRAERNPLDVKTYNLVT